MQRIMQAIREIIASIVLAFRTVMVSVFKAGRWTLEAVQVVTAPISRVADGLIDAALSIPRRILGGLGSGRPAVGQQAAHSANVAAGQVLAAKAEADKAMSLQATAALLQRAANARAKGRDFAELCQMLPVGIGAYVGRLGTGECEKLAAADVRDVIAFLSGARLSLPGIRTPGELDLDDARRNPSPAPGPNQDQTADEKQILDRLAQRIRARMSQRRMADNARTYDPA